MSASVGAFLERVERTCADAVERAFAMAFPTPIEPVQVARKLVAAFESGAASDSRTGRRFSVRLSANDYERFEGELPYLTAQWTTMLARLARRAGRPQRPPEVVAQRDATIATGTVTIGVETLDAPVRLALVVRRGLPPGAVARLDRDIVIGRDPSCDLVLVDARVSRRHLAIDPSLRFSDLGSANGTRHNGTVVASGSLGLGDSLVIGDTELTVEGAA
ncbi:MAG: hypothetical protein PVSMB8_06960 [Vulcanimicrobiaceae bacterium]